MISDYIMFTSYGCVRMTDIISAFLMCTLKGSST